MICFSLFSCESVEKEGYQTGPYRKSQLGDMSFQVKHMSPEEMVSLNGVEDKDVVNDYNKLEHFRLRLQADNAPDLLKHRLTSEQEYYDRLEYYSHRVKNDLYLVQGNTTIECLDVHMERNFGVAPYLDLNLVFPKLDDSKPFTLIFKEEIFGNGPIKFKYYNS